MSADGAFDLGIEGGELVTGHTRARANIYVREGRIAEVAEAQRPARRTLDASGLLVMPGMIDAHVHFMDPGDTEREDFPTGTAAAARAGVTTVIEHTHAAPVVSAADLERKAAHLAGRSHVDFALAAHAWPDRLDEVGDVWGAGAAFLKAFTCATHGLPGFDASALHELLTRAAGCGAPCLVHCEDESLTAAAERALRARGRTDPGVVPAWRNRAAEQVALSTLSTLARLTGATAVAAHVSHPDAIAVVSGARAQGANLFVESCPQYLCLLEDEVLEHGAFRKFTPPARARAPEELEEMWSALRTGEIDLISSDHAPSTPAQKRAGSIWEVHFGLPGVDTTLPVLLDAAHAGRISYERVAASYSEAPAHLYGLFPAKGSLRPGADADIVLVEPDARWTVQDADIVSRAGWSPLAGRTLTGRAVATYLRGEPVAGRGARELEAADAPVAALRGRFVAGPGSSGRAAGAAGRH